MRHRGAFALIFAVALLLLSSSVLRAQVPPVTDDEQKVKTYNRFVETREQNPAEAYEAAKSYMKLYGKEDDQYTRYFKIWIPAYEDDLRTRRLTAEREDREQQLLGAFTQKKFEDAYARANQVLNDDPNNVKVLIALGYGGVVASTESRNENFNGDAANYAQKAIQLIESGRVPDTWAPFKGKDDAVASLNYAIGFYWLRSRAEEAIGNLIKAAQSNSDRKTAPTTYYYLALAYQNGPYHRLSDDYQKRFSTQAESPESKAALDNINKVVDKIIDAYARAVALAGNDPQNQKAKDGWMVTLTNFYKFRHDKSDVGLTELIAGVLAKPLPQP